MNATSCGVLMTPLLVKIVLAAFLSSMMSCQIRGGRTRVQNAGRRGHLPHSALDQRADAVPDALAVPGRAEVPE